MARAGFYCSEQQLGTDSARCYVCQHELLWDPQDDPWFTFVFIAISKIDI